MSMFRRVSRSPFKLAFSTPFKNPFRNPLIIGGNSGAVLSINSPTVAESAGTITFTVTMSKVMPGTVTVNYATSSGTATSGTDVTAGTSALSGTLTYTTGQTVKTIVLNIADDATVEGTENFFVTLSSPSGATLGQSVGTGSITDNDNPSVSINSPTVGEGAGTIGFTVTLSASSSGTCTVDYTSASGSATVGTDVTAGTSPLNGTLTFTPGQTSKTITHNVTDDAFVEGTESYTVTLSNYVNCVAGTAVGTGTITDNDAAATVSTVSSNSAIEGLDIVHTVTMSSSAGATVAISAVGVTATGGGTDFTSTLTNAMFSNGVTISGGNITVPNGVSSFTVSIPTTVDVTVEPTETYTLTVGGVSGTGSILDNDYPKTFSLVLSAPSGFTLSDGTGVATINAPGASTITPNIAASRTSGTAPLAVYFDASATTAATLTSLPFHELLYIWDFGDTTGTYWAYGAKAGAADKNIAYGPQAAHVFETSGTKTVTLTVIHYSSGGVLSTNTTTQNITVTAESTTYPAANTYYIDSAALPVAGSGGVPSGANVIQTGDMATATAARTTANRMFFLKRGGTYNFASSYTVQKQGIRIRAYGSGAAPKITFSNAGDGFVLYDSTNDASDFQWHDCQFDGVSTSAGPGNWKLPIASQTSLGGSLKNILLMNCEATVNGSIASVSAVDGLFVVSCNLHDLSGGNGNVGVYSQYGSRLVVLGSNITNCSGIEHNIRSQGCDRVVVSNNTLSVPQNGKQMTTIRGYSQQASGGSIGAWSGIWSEKIVISDNSYDGGASYVGLCVEFAPQNAGAYERIREIICERNLFIGSIATAIGSEAESGVTIRNNLFQADYSGEQICVDIYSRNTAGVAAGSSTYVYNNSCYMAGAHAFSFARTTKGGPLDWPTGNLFTNNLAYAPNATANGFSSGSTASFLATASSGSYYTLTTNSSDSQMDVTVPGFTIPPTTTLTTWKPTTGYGINGGTYVKVFDDFFTATRTGTYDLGAVNP